MSSRLKNKVAIITGAAKGQGEFEARLFANEGATVVLCDIDVEACGKTAEEISSAGGNAVAMTLNVASEPDWMGAIEQTLDFFGKHLMRKNQLCFILSMKVITLYLRES